MNKTEQNEQNRTTGMETGNRLTGTGGEGRKGRKEAERPS